jgi:dynein heavy chain, axonemal
MDLFIEAKRPVLLTGMTGVGKTVIAQGCLDKLAPKGFPSITICFSAQTSAKDTQLLIESKLDKKRKNRLGAPPQQRQVIFFVDGKYISDGDTPTGCASVHFAASIC